MKKFKKLLFATFLAGFLGLTVTACGGGGSGATPTVNPGNTNQITPQERSDFMEIRREFMAVSNSLGEITPVDDGQMREIAALQTQLDALNQRLTAIESALNDGIAREFRRLFSAFIDSLDTIESGIIESDIDIADINLPALHFPDDTTDDDDVITDNTLTYSSGTRQAYRCASTGNGCIGETETTYLMQVGQDVSYHQFGVWLDSNGVAQLGFITHFRRVNGHPLIPHSGTATYKGNALWQTGNETEEFGYVHLDVQFTVGDAEGTGCIRSDQNGCGNDNVFTLDQSGGVSWQSYFIRATNGADTAPRYLAGWFHSEQTHGAFSGECGNASGVSCE